MYAELLLGVIHISAFLGLVVFLSSQITLCRASWWDATIVPRLLRLSYFYWGSVLAVLLSGLARAAFGVKTWAFYSAQPIFWFKLLAFIAISLMSLKVQKAYGRWRMSPSLCPDDLDAMRRRMMIQAHVIMLFPILGLMMAYGVGVR